MVRKRNRESDTESEEDAVGEREVDNQMWRRNSEGNMSRYYRAITKKKEVCYLCGIPGHESIGCPNEICLRCHLPGHKRRDCKRPPVYYNCYKCFKSHDPFVCPQSGNFEGPDLICCNCSRTGHLIERCPERKTQELQSIAQTHGVGYLSQLIFDQSQFLMKLKEEDRNRIYYHHRPLPGADRYRV